MAGGVAAASATPRPSPPVPRPAQLGLEELLLRDGTGGLLTCEVGELLSQAVDGDLEEPPKAALAAL